MLCGLRLSPRKFSTQEFSPFLAALCKSPHRNAPHSYQHDAMSPLVIPILSLSRFKKILQKMIVIGEKLIGKSSQYLKMEWSLSWNGSQKLGVCRRKILEHRKECLQQQAVGCTKQNKTWQYKTQFHTTT